jgi:hypothetical protein
VGRRERLTLAGRWVPDTKRTVGESRKPKGRLALGHRGDIARTVYQPGCRFAGHPRRGTEDRQDARPEQDARAGAPFPWPTNAGARMYIGIGTLVFILLVLMVIYFLRRA